jgi:hypothetical protein
MVTGIAVEPDGTLYAAEMATGDPANMVEPQFQPFTGRAVRQTGLDSLEEVATDMLFPPICGSVPMAGSTSRCLRWAPIMGKASSCASIQRPGARFRCRPALRQRPPARRSRHHHRHQ